MSLAAFVVPLIRGRVQPHIRGGASEPLSRGEIEDKFRGNCEFGGWPRARAQQFLDAVLRFFDGPLDLKPRRG